MPSPQAVPVREQESTAELLKRLMEELVTLFRQEISLATAEVSGALGKLAKGLMSVGAGAAVLYAGFLWLLAAAVFGLMRVMPGWLAALVVGGGVAIIGLIMVLAGKKKLEPSKLKPERTVESLRRDKDVLTRSGT